MCLAAPVALAVADATAATSQALAVADAAAAARHVPCTGDSSALLQSECVAWQDSFNATGGAVSWARGGGAQALLDPCSVVVEGGGVECAHVGVGVGSARGGGGGAGDTPRGRRAPPHQPPPAPPPPPPPPRSAVSIISIVIPANNLTGHLPLLTVSAGQQFPRNSADDLPGQKP